MTTAVLAVRSSGLSLSTPSAGCCCSSMMLSLLLSELRVAILSISPVMAGVEDRKSCGGRNDADVRFSGTIRDDLHCVRRLW